MEEESSRNNIFSEKKVLGNTQLAKKDFFNLEIKNLEVLYNQAYMLNKLFKIKDFILHSPTLQKKILTLEKWKIVRNICLAIILAGKLLFYKDSVGT
jgi:hypothetical protein